jgi:serine/threonine-protein kinase ULK/ATG1
MHKIAQIKLSDEFVVDMHSVLGKGSTGCVYAGLDVRTREKVAVKLIELSAISNPVTEYLLRMEKAALTTLESEYVVKGLRVLQDEKYCFLVTEYCNGGTLRQMIKSRGCLS